MQSNFASACQVSFGQPSICSRTHGFNHLYRISPDLTTSRDPPCYREVTSNLVPSNFPTHNISHKTSSHSFKMVSSRKRARRDVEPEADSPAPAAPLAGSDQSPETSLLYRIRNMWQFANLFQWIYLFGKVVKIDDSIDIDVSVS